MRKVFSPRLTLLLLSLLSAFYATAGKNTTSVTCFLNKRIGSAVFLYRVENGNAVSLGFKWLDNMNTCTFTFEAGKEGIYYLRKAGVQSTTFNYGMYLRPGDFKSIQVFVSDMSNDFDSCRIIDPKKETGYLQQWTGLFNDICKLGANRSKREEFFTAYKTFVRKAEALKQASVTSDVYFNQVFAEKIDADLQYVRAAAFFYFNERMNSCYDTTATHQHFYESLSKEKFTNAACLSSEHAIQWINYTLGYRQVLQTGGAPVQWWAVPFVQKVNQLKSDEVKGAYAANYLQTVKSYEQFKTEIAPLQPVLSKTGYGEEYQHKLDQLTVFEKGAQGYSFSLPDTQGKQVSLNGLKGKVVVIDIWAMWCASCLQEKPLYEKLADEYKDRNDIVFLGVSVDGAGKKDAWKSFVGRKGYKTIELLADPTGGIMAYYKIEGIPRYLIFDKEGKIVTVDAPRPSAPALKQLIEQNISSK